MNLKKALLVLLGIGVVVVSTTYSKEIFANSDSAVISKASKSETDVTNKKPNVIMYLGSNNAIVDSKVVQIDKDNLNIQPYKHEDKLFLPVTFVAKSFGYSVKWTVEKKTMNITLNDKVYTLKVDSNILSVGDKEIKMDSPAILMGSEIYISAKYLAEDILGKKLLTTKDGLIGISDSTDLFSTDQKIDDFTSKLNIPTLVGTKQNFINLTKTMFTNDYRSDEGMTNGGGGATSSAPTVTRSPENADSIKLKDGLESGFSETNIQVQGVDESDIIKTDGKYIYYVSNQKIVVVDAKNPADLKVVNTIKFENSYGNAFNPIEIFLDKNTLTVIGNAYSKDFYKSSNVSPEVDSKLETTYRPYINQTKVIVYNIEKITDIKEVRDFAIDGNYNSSRKINNIVYLLTNSYLNYYSGIKDEEFIMPAFRDSTKSSVTKIGFDSIYYFPGFGDLSYMNICSIDTVDTTKEVQVKTYLGSGNNIYSSAENLYVAISNYAFKRTGMTPEMSNTSSTNIYKFGLDNGNITYKSKATVRGNILNQFSMDEHKGVFRIATSARNFTNNDPSENNIYFLDETLKTIGKIEKLAKGEQIYSTRFMGDKIYMVTFKTIDPLFVIDAKDPKNPVVLGELKIPGYSTYLHPYDETHLIGFGYDTTTETIDGIEVVKNNGMKMSIFDVSDFKNPKEMFTEIIGDFGTYSELLYNHKVLTFSKEKNLLAFPINIMKNDTKNIDGFDYYGSLSFSGAVVYNIDLKTGFKLKTQISHFENMNDNNYEKLINRIIYIKDTLYTFSSQQAKSTDLKTYKNIGSVSFK